MLSHEGPKPCSLNSVLTNTPPPRFTPLSFIGLGKFVAGRIHQMQAEKVTWLPTTHGSAQTNHPPAPTANERMKPSSTPFSHVPPALTIETSCWKMSYHLTPGPRSGPTTPPYKLQTTTSLPQRPGFPVDVPIFLPHAGQRCLLNLVEERQE